MWMGFANEAPSNGGTLQLNEWLEWACLWLEVGQQLSGLWLAASWLSD